MLDSDPMSTEKNQTSNFIFGFKTNNETHISIYSDQLTCLQIYSLSYQSGAFDDRTITFINWILVSCATFRIFLGSVFSLERLCFVEGRN